jgi:L-amino acid N-acyltransferase YncA
MPAVIRPAMASDIDAIAVIYAYHVNHSTGTFETEAPDILEMTRRWKVVEARSLPWLVAEENGEITGYAYAAPYRTRAAYQHTVEDSIYVRADRVGTGLGKLLMPALIRATQRSGMHQMVAVIGDSANHPSISLHRRFGFQDAGLLKAVGLKFGSWLDTVFMQLNLREN